jgi:nucleotide-binding universal stress UspA family protein
MVQHLIVPVDGSQRSWRAFDVELTTEVRLTIGSVADELAKLVSLNPEAIIVMSSHGKGRSAALIGSVTEDVLHQTFGPIVLVGPNTEPDDFSGPVIVTVDGSHESEIALPPATACAAELHTTPWIVNVATQETTAANNTDDATRHDASMRRRVVPRPQRPLPSRHGKRQRRAY